MSPFCLRGIFKGSELPSRALSVRQPWAWAIIHGGKDIENRSTAAMRHGLARPGRIAVHASKGMTRDEYLFARAFMAKIGVTAPEPAQLVRGAIIGSVEVIGAVEKSNSPWFMGPRGLILIDPVACAPIPCIGALGYFDWRPATAKAMPAPAKWMTLSSPKVEIASREEAGEPPLPLFEPEGT